MEVPCLVWREGANPRGPLSKWGLHLPLPTGTFLLLLEQFQPPGRYPCRAPFPTPSTLFPPLKPQAAAGLSHRKGSPNPRPEQPLCQPLPFLPSFGNMRTPLSPLWSGDPARTGLCHCLGHCCVPVPGTVHPAGTQ